jgi:ferredoxin
MKKIINKLKRLLPTKRRLIQLYSALLFNANIKGFFNGKIYKGPLKNMCAPGINCYSCPGASAACPLGALQNSLAESNKRAPYYMFGIILLYGIMFGRFICGWLCPFGLFQDLLYKIPFKGKRKNLPGHKILVKLKYAVLIIFVITLPLAVTDIIGQGSPWFCKYICPSGTLMAGIPLTALDETLRNAAGNLFIWKMALLIITVMTAIIVYRPFCKYICPLGAIYSVFNPIALYRYQVNTDTCTKCGKCQRVCKMDIKVWEQPNHPECASGWQWKTLFFIV